MLDNLNLAYDVAHKYCGPDLDFPEALATAQTALVNAALRYDPNRGKFSAFAYTCMVNAIKVERRKLRVRRNTVSLFTELVNDGSGSQTLADTLAVSDQDNSLERMSDEYLHNAVNQVLNLFSGIEKGIIVYRFLHGWTQTRIAEHYGISQSYVSRLEKITLRKMREFLRALDPDIEAMLS